MRRAKSNGFPKANNSGTACRFSSAVPRPHAAKPDGHDHDRGWFEHYGCILVMILVADHRLLGRIRSVAPLRPTPNPLRAPDTCCAVWDRNFQARSGSEVQISSGTPL